MQNGEKHTRQQALLALLEERPFSSQLELVEEMSRRGFEATQPSISRDFRELGIVKLAGRYQQHQRPKVPESTGLIREVVTAGPHLLVVKTEAGAASIIGAAIDRMSSRHIVGTVAGDDTVFVAVDGKRGQRHTLELLNRLG